MILAFFLIIEFALLMALVVVIYNLGTGRYLFDDIDKASFLYSLHRRQYLRGRWEAVKRTWRDFQ